MDGTKYPQIGIRVDPEFRAEVRAAADRYHQGNESYMGREALKTYMALRSRLGSQYEPTIALLLGPPASEPQAVAS